MSRASRTIACVPPIVAAAVSVLPVVQAHAQSAQAGIEEIIVSARKREESLQDVPTTLQVFSGKELARDGVRDFGQIQQSIPNFLFFSDRAARAVVAVRGFGSTTTTNLAPGVGIYVDGVYQPSTAFFNAPLVDLERLEVLKGPQGTLFGRNAYAGAINIVTRRPGADVEASAQAEAANGGTQRAFASLSGPLLEGRLHGLLSGGFQQQDGFYEYAGTGNPADPSDYVIARSRLVFDATDRVSLDLTAQHFDLDTGGFRQHSIDGVDDDEENLTLNEPQYEQAKFTDVWLNTTAKLGAVDLIGISSYSEQRNDSLLDGDFGPSRLIDSRRFNDREIWSQELRAQSAGMQRFNWLIGAYYSQSKIVNDQVNSGGFYPSGALRTYGAEDAEIRAVFTDLTFGLTDRIELGAGLRYDEIEKDGSSANLRLMPGGPVQLFSTALQGKYDAVQPKVSLRYTVTPDINAYVTYSKGFREGGLNLNAPGTPVQSFDSDEIESYEAGLKGMSGDGRIRYNASVFYMDAPSYNSSGVYANPLGGATLVTINVGSAESYGIEADAVAALNELWSLNASVGYMKAKWTQVDNPSLGTRPGDALAFTPEWTGTLGARGEFPLGDDGLRLEVAASLSAKDKTVLSYSANAGPNIRAAFATLDASVGVARDRWRAVLFGRNLADERYPEQFTSASVMAVFGAVKDLAQLSQPRTYGLRVEYRY